MLLRHFATMTFALCAAVLAAAAAQAADAYPSKPIRIVAPGVGGSGDWTARLVAQGMTELIGQNVIVENRNGVTAIETVARAQPDGYTILFFGSGLWNMWLLQKVSYDPLRDFLPVIGVASSPSVITVHPSLAVNSVKELIAYAKAKPGQLNYSSGQTGTVGHLAGELFKSMAGVNIVHVPYKSTGASIVALIGGEVQLTFAAIDTVSAHLKSGKVRALAVMSEAPTKLAPGLPTVSASGLPGYVVASNNALWAPARTPAVVMERLYQATAAYLKRPEVDKRLFDVGLDALAMPPDEFKKKMTLEIVRWSKLIKQLNIKSE